MAEKTAVFSLKVDTGKSVQDIQAFDKAVEDLNKDLKDTSKTATDASTKGMETFDQKLAELNQRLEDGGLSMREMTKLMKEYQNLAARAGAESPIGKQAISNAAGLKDEIGDLKAQTMALSSDFVGLDTTLQGVETGAAAFQGIQSAAALAGVENEALVQTMVKLQAVQGLVNSVSIIANNLNKESILGLQLRNGLEKAKNFIMTGSIAPALAGVAATQAQTGANVGLATATGGATTAMKLFRLALISTGIGAIVVGIGLLIANFDKVSAAVTKAYNWFDKLGPKIKILSAVILGLVSGPLLIFVGAIYGIVKALEYFGVIDDAQTAKMKANAKAKTDATEKEMNKKIAAEKKKAKAVDDNLSFEIRKAEAAGKTTEEMEEKKLKAALKSGRAIFQMQKQKIAAYEEELALLKSLGDADSDRAKKLEKSLKDTKRASYEQYKENKKNSQDLTILEIEEQKKRDDANKDAEKKREDAAKAAAEKRKARREKEKEEELNRLKAIAEAEKKANEERIKAEDDRFALSMELMQAGFEKELQELVIQSDKRLEQAHGDKQLEAQVEMQFQIDKADLIKKYSDIELAKLAETEAKKREIREKYTRLFNSDKDNELMDLKATYESEKDIALDALKAGLIDEEEYLDKENILTEKYKKKKAEIDKKYSDMEKENAIKSREEQLKGVTQAIEGAQEALNQLKDLNALMNEIDQARLNKIAENRDADLANLDAKLQAELNQEGLTADQKKQIEEKFAKQKYDVQLKAYEEEEKIKKAQFNRDKALKLAQIAIDTASAIVKGIAQFGPPPSPAGIAAIASAGLIGLTQALAVMNQKYQSGTAPTPPQLSTGGGGGQAGAGASSFTANTNAQQTDLTTLGQGQGGNVPVSQVVVLESDITGTQNKVEVQEAKSTF
jgi:hypothetical protein